MAFEGGFGGTLHHFGVTLGALAAYGGAFGSHFEVILGSVWGQSGYLRVGLGHLMVTLQWLSSHFVYRKVRFQKTLISHTDLNDFI